MDQVAITPHPDHQTSSCGGKGGGEDFCKTQHSVNFTGTSYDITDTPPVRPRPTTISQECLTKSPLFKLTPAPSSPLHCHERVISHPLTYEYDFLPFDLNEHMQDICTVNIVHQAVI